MVSPGPIRNAPSRSPVRPERRRDEGPVHSHDANAADWTARRNCRGRSVPGVRRKQHHHGRRSASRRRHRSCVTMSAETPHRCAWAESDPLLRAYHDEEWGVPEYDSRALWEKLMLDGFQAGLSWLTILRKRDAFREAFKNFDPERVARFGEADIVKLLDNARIVRSRAKIEATIGGPRAYLPIPDPGQAFSTLLWDMVGGSPLP